MSSPGWGCGGCGRGDLGEITNDYGGDDESPLFCAKNYKEKGEESWLNKRVARICLEVYIFRRYKVGVLYELWIW